MEILGYITLTFFLVAMVLTLLRKINLPVQTVLILVTLICMGFGAVFLFFLDGAEAVLAIPNRVMGGIILHPVTALLAGLFMSGALQASGGFDAFKVLIEKLNRSPLGLPGTLVLLTQIPLIASLPCGRIIAAALLPLLFFFGSEGGLNLLTRAQMIVLIGAFARNAFGSCGPSPIGGVGQIGEGFLGSHFATAANGILRAPQAFGIILGTAVTALFLKFISQKLYPDDVQLKDIQPETEEVKTGPERAPLTGYIALVLFVASLVIAIFQPFGKMPVQTVLVVGAALIIVISRAKLDDMMAGIILLPVTAMVSGFMAAGALYATGGFDALGTILKGLSAIPILGVAGMLAIFVQVQTIIPLSCSRILTAALVPVLYMFGPAGFSLLTWPQLAIAMAAYIVNATTSCGPSPLGGGGMMGEGQMRAESGYIKGAYTFTAMATMAPLAAVYMKFLNLSVFEPGNPEFTRDLLTIGVYAVIVVGANLIGIRVVKTMIDRGKGHPANFGLFLFNGVLAGAVLTAAVFGFDPLTLAQGGIGGGVAAFLIVAMVPRRLTPEPAVVV